jgi:hypothetical protein
MVHHAAPEQVARAIEEIGQGTRLQAIARHAAMAEGMPRRQWLHIGEERAAA